MNRRLVLAGFGALLAATVLSTGVARADVNDDTFIQVINEQGITYTSEANLIAGGHLVCDQRDQGYTEMQIIGDILAQTELTSYNAGYFVGAAEASYCPWHMSAQPAPDHGPLKQAV